MKHSPLWAMALLAGLTPWPVRGQQPALDSLESDARAVGEDAVIHAAMEGNLLFRASLLDPRAAEMDVRFARSAFDPTLRSFPSLSRSNGSLFADQNGIPGFARFGMVSGAWGGSLDGSLLSGTRYSILGQTQVRRNDPTLAPSLSRAYDNALTFSLTQPLLKGFGPRLATAGIEDAELGHDAAVLRTDRAAEELVAQIRRLYWALDFTEETERADRRSLGRARAVLDRQQELLRLGRISSSDLLTARVAFVQRQADLVAASRDRADAMERLAFAVLGDGAAARIHQGTFLATDTLEVAVPALSSVEEEETRALLNRRDRESARLELERSRVGLRVARNARLPQLDLTGGLTLGAANANRLGLSSNVLAQVEGSAQSREWSAGVSMSWPLLNRGATARTEQARILMVQGELALRELENRIRGEVRQAVRATSAAQAQLAIAREGARLALEQFENEQALLKLGRSDPFRLLQMEEQAALAERSALLARMAVVNAVVDYQLASGTLLKTYFPGGYQARPAARPGSR